MIKVLSFAKSLVDRMSEPNKVCQTMQKVLIGLASKTCNLTMMVV